MNFLQEQSKDRQWFVEVMKLTALAACINNSCNLSEYFTPQVIMWVFSNSQVVEARVRMRAAILIGRLASTDPLILCQNDAIRQELVNWFQRTMEQDEEIICLQAMKTMADLHLKLTELKREAFMKPSFIFILNLSMNKILDEKSIQNGTQTQFQDAVNDIVQNCDFRNL